jgi:hypothetical protein
VRISDVVYSQAKSLKRNRQSSQLDVPSDRFGRSLSNLARALTRDGRVKHSEYLHWSRPFLSKSRYMCGLQCSKKLWQTVYDPEPVEEPLPGTVKGMGIEVGIKARLLWPGGVLVDDPKHHDYDEAVRRTKALIADPTVPAIFEATLVYDGVLVRVDALETPRWPLAIERSEVKHQDQG